MFMIVWLTAGAPNAQNGAPREVASVWARPRVTSPHARRQMVAIPRAAAFLLLAPSNFFCADRSLRSKCKLHLMQMQGGC